VFGKAVDSELHLPHTFHSLTTPTTTTTTAAANGEGRHKKHSHGKSGSTGGPGAAPEALSLPSVLGASLKPGEHHAGTGRNSNVGQANNATQNQGLASMSLFLAMCAIFQR
jgi:hypothetical protein